MATLLPCNQKYNQPNPVGSNPAYVTQTNTMRVLCQGEYCNVVVIDCYIDYKQERNFQISKHNFLDINKNMGWTIVSANKTSSVTQLENHAIELVPIENV